jgi:UDP-N-acetylglucosamine--N-acetylmuramyl-(pentapeptide) pyrophosphoryl-undecaprenol N-acetylglucosamine transferase
LPLLAKRAPHWQWFHLAGRGEAEKVSQAYAALALTAVVHPFFDRMELALGAATAAVSRSGASSLAELAAMRVPAVLVPYPTATGNHQFHNARAFEATGAARLLEQKNASSETLADLLDDLIEKPNVRGKVQNALAQWHAPHAAEQIAEVMLTALGVEASAPPLGRQLHLRRSLPGRGNDSAVSPELRMIA